MLSRSTLELLDAITRAGSFSGAGVLLNKVPSAVSHSVKQLEDDLGVTLFDRNHRNVSLTTAGQYFVNEARAMLKHMDRMEANVVRIAKGWRPSLTIAVDVILSLEHLNQLITAFSQEFDDVELRVRMEIFNGVWDALVTGRADIAIGATTAIPVDGQFDYKEMGSIDWVFVVGKTHPLAENSAGMGALELSPYPSIGLEDTSREIPRRTTWRLPHQRKLIVPNWEVALDAAKSGAGVGYFPQHVASRSILEGSLIEKCLSEPKAPSPCCLAWSTDEQSPALTWVLEYLGDAEHLQRQWIA
jgi:DNA-binding transcriptional LysR family regulator